jgi:hypothetical protein
MYFVKLLEELEKLVTLTGMTVVLRVMISVFRTLGFNPKQQGVNA